MLLLSLGVVISLSALPGSAAAAPPKGADALEFWSLRPLRSVDLPTNTPVDAAWSRNPIDQFITAERSRHKLSATPEADRRTLLRRLFFDLTGLPPTPEEIRDFVTDPAIDAYERRVDRLLASPRYGERWARHWLDLVHYGDSHGYDKDKPRPNAWPYRDYVVRAFNEDKPFRQFVLEQVAGDVLFPETRDGVEATGFIAAGPWDFIGHAEVPESKIDGQVARNLDRDDMVANTMNTFVSMTVQCARCHDHKFDPVTQEDYYSMQAVFAALDRADRRYDLDPKIARQRRAWRDQQRALQARAGALTNQVAARITAELTALDQAIKLLHGKTSGKPSAAFGYHSQIEARSDTPKWVQIDLGQPLSLERITFTACDDDFNSIGPGFGFPLRFHIELSDDPEFETGTRSIADYRSQDVPNPGVKPSTVVVGGQKGRYVRFTATKLALRQNDYILALAELIVQGAPDGTNIALGKSVTALDSIEAPPRWARQNLVDGKVPGGAASDPAELARLVSDRGAALERAMNESERLEWLELRRNLTNVQAQLQTLPAESAVYAGTVYKGSGAFAGTGGKPRTIRVLHRGDVTSPRAEVAPGTVPIIPGIKARFDLAPAASEGERRAALAHWIVDPQNPLTWRSIVNRIWQHHMGRGLVATANDFGRMGDVPTHPALLDWLASEFRQTGSIKGLHRLIVTSATYRQASTAEAASPPPEGARAVESAAVSSPQSIDAGNQYYWRMNRRRLQAEELRDTVLMVAGRLDHRMGGPGFQEFVIEKPEHSPHYQYDLHSPDDPRSHRRSIYRFLVRSQQSLFMTTLDCADPSQLVAKRNETLTALQALALLNNKLMLAMSRHFAQRLERDEGTRAGGVSLSSLPRAKEDVGVKERLAQELHQAYQLALGRDPSDIELRELVAFAREHGLPNACRVIFNLNEFMFID